MHELARLVRTAQRAVRTYDRDLGIGNRLTHGAGPAIDLGRRQIRGAERLREAVHEEDLRLRQRAPQLLQNRTGHRAARVRDVAQVLDRVRRPGQLGELRPQRRHAREPGDALLGEHRNDVAREQVVHEDRARAGQERSRDLAEAIVEAERQHGEQSIVRSILQVLRDALRAGHHVPMREHDALGTPGAAGGVEDRQHVHVDDTMGAQRVARTQHVAPCGDSEIASFLRRAGVADQDEMS